MVKFIKKTKKRWKRMKMNPEVTMVTMEREKVWLKISKSEAQFNKM